jgi:polar amino acid transport system substrate-binding protein
VHQPRSDAKHCTRAGRRQQRGKLRAGVDQDTYLFGSRNPQTGVIEGFDIDMLRSVAMAIFGDDKHLELVPIKYKDRVQSVVDGKVDIVADTFTIKCSRWALINFSTEYYSASQKILVRKDSTAKGVADLSGQRVCAATGSTSVDNIKASNPKAVVVEVLDQTDCLILFQSSQVDAISTDDTILLGLNAQDPNAKLLTQSFSPEPYGLGLPKGDAAFTGFVNKVLEEMRSDGRWKKIHHDWLGKVFPGETPESPRARYR